MPASTEVVAEEKRKVRKTDVDVLASHPPAKLNLPSAGPRPRTPTQCWVDNSMGARVHFFIFCDLAQVATLSVVRREGVHPPKKKVS